MFSRQPLLFGRLGLHLLDLLQLVRLQAAENQVIHGVVNFNMSRGGYLPTGDTLLVPI